MSELGDIHDQIATVQEALDDIRTLAEWGAMTPDAALTLMAIHVHVMKEYMAKDMNAATLVTCALRIAIKLCSHPEITVTLSVAE